MAFFKNIKGLYGKLKEKANNQPLSLSKPSIKYSASSNSLISIKS